MLQSVKLCTDQLNTITTTTANTAAAAATASSALAGAVLVVNPASAVPTPVAIVNANTNGSILDSNNLNSTATTVASNGIVHRQLHQYKGKYLDAAANVSVTTKFHPYLRPTGVAGGENSSSSATGTGPSTFAATLFPAFQHSVNSIATTNKTPATTIVVAAVNATTSPTRLLTLPAKQPTAVCSVKTAAATTGFINSNSGYANSNNFTPLHVKSEIMSESEEFNDAQQSGNGRSRSVATYDEPMVDEDSNLLAHTNNNCGDGNSVYNANVSTDDEFAKDQPDPDNIKMFVGQIPKSWDETHLRKMFEQYGRVHTLNVLRDKVTSMSRGCCFVTYYTRKAALKAQDALHNIKTLEGMHHPIQMKPADSENRNERKLFVGMLNKKYNEADVRQLFTGHGTIEECTVLRDQNGQSKGCAFVTFATKHNAIGAIKALHQSRTMDGCSAPLVVKFADTQKEKDQKKMQQLQASLVGISALPTPATGGIHGLTTSPTNGFISAAAANALVPSPVSAVNVRSNSSMSAALAAVSAQQASAVGNTASALVPTSAAISVRPTLLAAAANTQQTSPYLTTTEAINASATQLQLFQQLQAFGFHPAQYLQGLNFPPDNSVTTASLSAAASAAANAAATASDTSGQPSNTPGNGLLTARSISMQNLVTLATMGSHHYSPTQSIHAQPHNQAVAQTPQQHQQHAHPISTTQNPSLSASTHAQMHMAHLLAAQQTPLTMTAQLTGATTAALWPGANSLTSPYVSALSPLGTAANYTTAASPVNTSTIQAAAAGVAGKQIEGPEGSNLFIYHLPQEFTDTDLASTFLPFGNVLSAKVFIDKQTNLSKCFGFVSYDNPHSASAAIQAMHGFQIGTKRLKVQLKRSKDTAKPY